MNSNKSFNAPRQPPAAPPPAEPIKALAQADAHVRERTGRGWDEWFALLDDWGATKRTHTEIARHLSEDARVDHWWSQNIAVTYEQTRGMREPGQGSDGYFIASATKTINVPADRVFESFIDPGLREQWLPGIKVHVRTATAPKIFRADWEDEPTRISVAITPKGEKKAHVAINHEKLTDAGTAAQKKAFWRDHLAELKQLLEF